LFLGGAAVHRCDKKIASKSGLSRRWGRRESYIPHAMKISDLCQRNFDYSESFPSALNSRRFARSFFAVETRANPALPQVQFLYLNNAPPAHKRRYAPVFNLRIHEAIDAK
jgi:hypothetical protein